MGSGQSKVDIEHEKLVVEQLHAMSISKQRAMDEEYVHVGNEKAAVREVRHQKDMALNVKDVFEWETQLFQDPKNRLALSALSSADPKTVLTSRKAVIKDQQIFNVKIDFEGAPVTNQRSSGRCWLFASTNVFRVALMKHYNLDKFELSQAYLFFWDKLEKANFFLEQILDTTEEDLDSRLIQRLLEVPVNDGGQWDMVFNLVTKYGLVPQSLYPDSFNAMNSSAINSVITTKLREDALILRKMVNSSSATNSSISEMKEKMMREVHLILTLTLGPPPSPNEKFSWTYLDKSGKACSLNTTPLDFAKSMSNKNTVRLLSCDVTTMFSLVNDPRNELLKHLSVSRLNNISSPTARPITYINLPMSTIKSAAISMLKADLPIFFGCDVGKYSNRGGIMDLDLIDYELGFNVKLGMSKGERLRTGESAMTHAMVLTGVHVEKNAKGEDVPVRWRVMNSWGKEAGDEGYFVMSDAWMDEFVYQVVVEPRFVDKKVTDLLKTKATVLPLWDPLGSLA